MYIPVTLREKDSFNCLTCSYPTSIYRTNLFYIAWVPRSCSLGLAARNTEHREKYFLSVKPKFKIKFIVWESFNFSTLLDTDVFVQSTNNDSAAFWQEAQFCI